MKGVFYKKAVFSTKNILKESFRQTQRKEVNKY
jgi:hypothetical protein